MPRRPKPPHTRITANDRPNTIECPKCHASVKPRVLEPIRGTRPQEWNVWFQPHGCTQRTK